ncbi:MAG TPA: iron-sulfur cluster repair di-iron protein [Pyrinomonadaceae bacterium]|nr:iron-sulfur cluster repair di-iron protein [Pyrinomonadaceae bacterium]
MNASQKTVGEFAVEFPNATRLFEQLGIDYCCGGNRPLEEACADAGVSVDEVMHWQELSSKPEKDEPNFAKVSLKTLITHIVEKHHVYTRSEIERLRALIEKVWNAHGANHPEIARLSSTFRALGAELEPHMTKEELVLFPYILRLEEATLSHHSVGTPPFRTVANPVHMMNKEHEGAGYLLSQMRQITSDYTTPPDGCISYQTLYKALDEFEQDLHQHIHLETNILFPRAIEMEIGLLA